MKRLVSLLALCLAMATLTGCGIEMFNFGRKYPPIPENRNGRYQFSTAPSGQGGVMLYKMDTTTGEVWRKRSNEAPVTTEYVNQKWEKVSGN